MPRKPIKNISEENYSIQVTRRMTFLPVHIEESIFFAEKLFFVFTFSLNVVALGFLLKRTPPNQATFRNYLILIQIFVMVTDLVLEVLSDPIPLFPEFGGYCCGIICRMGLSTNNFFGLVVLLLANIGVSIVMCCIYRHQTILFDSNPFKLRKGTLQIVRLALLIFFNSAPMILMLRTVDYKTVERLVDERNLGWIRDRCDNYLVEERSPRISLFLYNVIGVLFCASICLIAMFTHMNYVLHQESPRKSSKSAVTVRRSLIVLIIQLIVPYSLIIFPSTVIFLGLATPNLVSFESSLAMFYLIHFHSVGHNIILLTITAPYRQAIVKFIKCCRGVHSQSTVHSLSIALY